MKYAVKRGEETLCVCDSKRRAIEIKEAMTPDFYRIEEIEIKESKALFQEGIVKNILSLNLEELINHFKACDKYLLSCHIVDLKLELDYEIKLSRIINIIDGPRFDVSISRLLSAFIDLEFEDMALLNKIKQLKVGRIHNDPNRRYEYYKKEGGM